MTSSYGVKLNITVAMQVPARSGFTFAFKMFDAFQPLAHWHLGKDGEIPDTSHYEVIEGHQNLYFDFDGELDIEALSNAIKVRFKQLEEEYKKPLPISADLYSSSDRTKKSYHVVVKGVCFNDHIACGRIAQEIINIASRTNPKLAESFDSSVYTSKRNLRLLHSRKIDSTRVKTSSGPIFRSPEYIPPADDVTSLFLTSLVSYVCKCQLIDTNSSQAHINAQMLLHQNASLQGALSETISEDIVKQALELVNERMPGIFSRREVRDRTLVLRRERPGLCCVCERVHNNENAMVIVRHSSGITTDFSSRSFDFVCFRDLSRFTSLNCNEEVELPVAKDDGSVVRRKIGVFGGKHQVAQQVAEPEQISRGSSAQNIEEFAAKIVRRYAFSV
jgi:hypothetical protein